LLHHQGRERLRSADSAHSGFTLIEVVVAIGLLAVVMTIVYSAFARSIDVTRETAEVTERVRQVQVITERLVDELSAAYWSNKPMVPASSDTEGRGSFVGTTEAAMDSEVRLDRLVWTTFAHRRYVADRPEADVSEVTYRVEVGPDSTEGRLVRDERINVFADAGWAMQSDDLADGVSEFRLRYLIKGEWVDEWDASQRLRLPDAVEVTVALAGKGNAPPERMRTIVALPLATR
jgi:general secretion pathway protein J